MACAGIGDKVEGAHAVKAAVAAGRVTKLTVDASRRDAEIAALIAEVESRGAEVEIVSDIASLAVTDAPQGLVADAEPIKPVDLESAFAATEPAAVVVLDHLEDPRNVGAVARSAAAAGIKALVVPERRAAPLGPTAFKAAAGAFEDLSITVVSSVADAVVLLKDLGAWVVGLDARGERSVFGLDLLAEHVALVVGAEGTGLGRLVAERADIVVSIPHAGPTESLNASVAASLAMYEVARARGWVT